MYWIKSIFISILLSGVIALLIYFSGPAGPQYQQGVMIVFGIFLIPFIPVTWTVLLLYGEHKNPNYVIITVKGEIDKIKDQIVHSFEQDGWRKWKMGEMTGKYFKHIASKSNLIALTGLPGTIGGDPRKGVEIFFEISGSSENWQIKLVNGSSVDFHGRKRTVEFDGFVKILIDRFRTQGLLINIVKHLGVAEGRSKEFNQERNA